MKKLLLVFSMFTFSIYASAANMKQDKSDGCGPGWYVYDKKTILGTTIRGTFNPSSSNTSGMSSGTSSCEKHSLVMRERQQEHFTERNYNTLVAEMAMGQGEFLKEYSQIFGCEVTSFGKAMQKNYLSIIPKKHDVNSLIRNVKAQISSLKCAV